MGNENHAGRGNWWTLGRTLGAGVLLLGGTTVAALECYNSDRCFVGPTLTDPRVQQDTVRAVRTPQVRRALPTSATVFTLELISLKCYTTQERRRHAPDEVYLKVMDDHVTNVFKMGAGHMANLDRLSPYPFMGSAEIELWDRDPGDNPNEYLGNTFARESDHTKGEVAAELTGSGAHYVLTYRVKKGSRPDERSETGPGVDHPVI